MRMIFFTIFTFAITANAHAYFYDGNILVEKMRDCKESTPRGGGIGLPLKGDLVCLAP